jgi:hypothetical protein
MRHMNDSISSRLQRLTADPVRLRRRGWWLAALVSAVSGGAYALSDAPLATLVVALGWVAAPFIAGAIGVGDAFFVSHGRSVRRVLLVTVGGGMVALLSCVLLASAGERGGSRGAQVFAAFGYAALFSAIVVLLAGCLALAIGRGSSYVARRIQETDDTGW